MAPTTIPTLPSTDFDITARFWIGLGFVEAARWPGSYLIMRHPAPIELHFFASGTLDPSRNDHGGYVRFPSAVDVERLFDEWSADLSPGRIQPPADTGYGLREGAIVDPMGNLLRIGGVIESRPTFVGLSVDNPTAGPDGVEFWSRAFDGTPMGGDGSFVTLEGTGLGVDVEVQQIGEGEPRFHIDFAVDDVDGGADHFERLGAERVARIESWWVMRAPTGQLFCLVPR